MTTLNITFDEKLFPFSRLNKEEVQQDLKEILAAKLFELGRLTLSQAATLAGLPLWTFMETLSRLKVSVINTTPEQFADELTQE